MNSIAEASSFSRFVACDLHKHYEVVAALNRNQEVVLKPRRLAIGELSTWAKTHLWSTGSPHQPGTHLNPPQESPPKRHSSLCASATGRQVFADKNRKWWQDLPLSPTEQLRLRQDLRTLDHVQQQLGEVEAELARLSTVVPWKDFVPSLVQLPGFGLITAMTVLAAIGDISRFPTDKHLVGYAGLGAGIHDSGETHRGKGITKTGRRDLRRVQVEAAWTAVETHPYWKAQFERLLRHKHKNQAIVAIARRLLVAVWHVLSERVADKNAIPKMLTFMLMVWSWKLSDHERSGLTSRSSSATP